MEIKKLSKILLESNEPSDEELAKMYPTSIDKYARKKRWRQEQWDNEQDEEQNRFKYQDAKNKKREEEQLALQASHKKEESPEEKMPDFNSIKTEMADQIGEIIFYSLKDGDETPLKELKALIAKYTNYLKTQIVHPMAGKDVKTFSDYSGSDAVNRGNSSNVVGGFMSGIPGDVSGGILGAGFDALGNILSR